MLGVMTETGKERHDRELQEVRAQNQIDRMVQRMRDDIERHRAEHEAWVREPLPRYLHFCFRHIQRAGRIEDRLVLRCACGSICVGGGYYMDKNSSRKFHRAERAKRGLKKRGRIKESAVWLEGAV